MPAADLARRIDHTLLAPEATERAEAMEAVRDGAAEIDIGMDIGWLLDRRSDAVADEICDVRDGLGAGGATVGDVRLLKVAVGERG